MRKRIFFIIGVLFATLCFSNQISGQRIDSDRFRENVEKVRELCDKNLYTSAEFEIERLRPVMEFMTYQERMEIDLYSLLCGVKMKRADVDASFSEFESRYGNAAGMQGARLIYAEYYFNLKEYSRTLEILNGVNYSFLDNNQKQDFLFFRSFSYLRVGKTSESLSGFTELLSFKNTRYFTASTYYSGYIHYLQGNFKTAISLFDKVKNDVAYSSICGYYILESKFMLKDYDYVIRQGERVSGIVDDSMKPQVARIVSEAYFENGDSENAKEWFELYSRSGNNGLSRKDHYYSGIISYSLQLYNNAIDAFGHVVSKEDSLTQSALFHTANSYLALKNKHQALVYFKKASELDFDRNIREESFFNYAKLSFDLNSIIKPFEDYMEYFPMTKRKDEIYSYIATSYLLSKKYKAAIEALDKISDPDPVMKANYQKAAFFRGMKFMEKGSYSQAISSFNMSLENSEYNRNLMLLTKFWKAEALYRLGKYDESLKINISLADNSRFKNFREYPLLLFNCGYCYFVKEEYQKAIEAFNSYLAKHHTNMDLIIESKTRIADSYFVMKDYQKAASCYEEVSLLNYQSENIIYSTYQSAICYGLLMNMDKKQEILERLFKYPSDSPLYPQAIYELGRTYVQTGAISKAQITFNYIISDMSKSNFYGKAMIEMGLLYSNMEHYEEAFDYLTRVVEELPSSEDCENALAVIESIYMIQNRPDDYLLYLESVGRGASKSDDEKETLFFTSAEQLYLSGNYSEALKSLSSFKDKYPVSSKKSLVDFYMAESYLALGNVEQAAAAYEEVVNEGEGAFVEIATLKYADIAYKTEEYEKAYESFQSLAEIARLDNNKYSAVVGMMRSGYMCGKYNAAINSATALIVSATTPEEMVIEAKYISAKSLIATERREEAAPYLKAISEFKLTPYGAEACYILIQETFDKGDFDEVENMVYDFSDSNTDQLYWLARSFIVLGDSFAERDEMEQAEATFRSIRSDYSPASDTDDIYDQVDLRLEKLEKMKSSNE